MSSDDRTNRRERAFFLAAVAVLAACLLAVYGQARRRAGEHAREVARLRERVRLAEDVREREQAFAQARRSERLGRRVRAHLGASRESASGLR
jgi:hypothetical protein